MIVVHPTAITRNNADARDGGPPHQAADSPDHGLVDSRILAHVIEVEFFSRDIGGVGKLLPIQEVFAAVVPLAETGALRRIRVLIAAAKDRAIVVTSNAGAL